MRRYRPLPVALAMALLVPVPAFAATPAPETGPAPAMDLAQIDGAAVALLGRAYAATFERTVPFRITATFSAEGQGAGGTLVIEFDPAGPSERILTTPAGGSELDTQEEIRIGRLEYRRAPDGVAYTKRDLGKGVLFFFPERFPEKLRNEIAPLVFGLLGSGRAEIRMGAAAPCVVAPGDCRTIEVAGRLGDPGGEPIVPVVIRIATDPGTGEPVIDSLRYEDAAAALATASDGTDPASGADGPAASPGATPEAVTVGEGPRVVVEIVVERGAGIVIEKPENVVREKGGKGR